MRMEQYIQMVDYSQWEVIENGNAPPITKLVEGVETIIAYATAKEKAQMRLELKAISTLLIGIPNEHQLKFNSIKDTKSLVQAIEKDVNQKFLRSLSQEWNTHTIVLRNKPMIDTLSLDDLYNNLKIYEPEVKGTSILSTNIQEVAFVSSNSTSSTNGAVNTAHGATTAKEMDLRWQMAMLTMRARRFLKNTRRKFFVNGTETIGFDKSKVECYNCHKRGHFARECRAPRNQENRNRENTRSVPVETTTSNALISCDSLAGYVWSDQAEEGPTNFALMAYSFTSSNSKVSTDSNCSSSCLENVKILKEQNEQLLNDLRTSKINAITYKIGLESVKARLLVYKKNESIYEEDIKVLKCLGYNVIPPPYTGNFMPPKPDFSFSGLEEFVNEPIVSEPTVKKPKVETSEAKASVDKPKVVRKTNGALIIEDWVSDSEEDDVPQAKIQKKTIKPSFAKIEFVKSKEQVKSPRKTTVKQGSNFEMFNKACYVCGSFDHLQYDCDNHQRQFNNKKMVKPVWNYTQRVNNQNFSRMTHPSPKRNMVPKAALMRSGLVSLTTARPVNTVQPRTIVNSARPITTVFNKAHSTVIRPINNKTATKNSNFNKRVNTVSGKNVNTDRPKAVVNAARLKAVLNVILDHEPLGSDTNCREFFTIVKAHRIKKQKEGGIFISQDKYVTEILKKFGFTNVKTASTPMETQKPLLKDEDGKEVDVHLYRSMIGSLMYLTSLRPAIMFVVCACARYQVNPKVSHLNVVKRIFRYLKGQSKLRLWYLKDSPFDLVAYTDSGCAKASLDMKSTTRGINLLLLLKVNAARHNLQLLVNVNAVEATVKVKIVNEEVQLQALADEKKIIVTEAYVRHELQLNDEESMDCLPNATIFEELTRMGYERLSQKLTFYKAFFSSQWKFLIHTILQCLSAKTTAWNEFSSWKQKSRRSKRKDTEVPQPSDPTNVADETVNEEPSMQLKELMDFCTKLQQRVLNLANTKTAQAQEITSLKLRVKKLENKGGSRTHKLKRLYKVGRSTRIVSSDEASLGDQEDGRHDDDIMFNVSDLAGEEVFVAEQGVPDNKKDDVAQVNIADVCTASTILVSAATITEDEITLAQALTELKSAKPTIAAGTRPKAKGLVIHEEELDEELAFKLQAEEEEEEERLVREKVEASVALTKEWNGIQAKIKTDCELAQRLQAEEEEELTVNEKATLFQQLLGIGMLMNWNLKELEFVKTIACLVGKK
ncbi:ribonuclease H-like domain-containing protein [Tanacetum coccineum]